LHATMRTTSTSIIGVHCPFQGAARALLAEVASKWANV
jgi:hypothetical protein